MTSKECNIFLENAMEFGRRLMATGCEARRVEDTIARICDAYGFEDSQVYSITNLIIVTIKNADGEHFTQSLRVHAYGTDLGRLEELNAQSRYICENKPPLEEFVDMVQSYQKPKPHFFLKMAGYMVSAGSFAVLFGGNWLDAIASAVIASIIYLLDIYLRPKVGNNTIYTFAASLISGCLALVMVHFGFGVNSDKIMIGDVMLLIPGLLLVNAIKEMFNRDIYTGLHRFVEAILVAVAIGGGFALSYIVMGGVL